MRARGIIDAHGGDTLDYFALRDDKSWFFTGESVVAYSVLNGVMLISPDPIGPPGDRAGVWSDVMDFAEGNDWQPAVLAASGSWLPVYRAAGLVDHYIGDEAIVDCSVFTLKGKSMKSLRGAYNRVQKEGCRVECYLSGEGLSDEVRGPAARADDRDAPGRSRTGLLHDAQPHLRPTRRRPPARRLLRPRRAPPGVQPVRPGQSRSTGSRST